MDHVEAERIAKLRSGVQLGADRVTELKLMLVRGDATGSYIKRKLENIEQHLLGLNADDESEFGYNPDLALAEAELADEEGN